MRTRAPVLLTQPAAVPTISKPRRCRHCSEAVPDGLPGEFCCRGCEAVHALLHEHRLDRYYELGRGAPIGDVPRPGRLDWLPDLERAALPVGNARRLALDVQGIRCAACVWVLQELWQRQTGALRIELNPAVGQVTLLYDQASTALRGWIDAVERLGYRVGPPTARSRDRSLLVRMGVCIALAMNAMLFAISGYFGLDAVGGALSRLFGWLSLAIATAAVLVGGPVFFRAALGGLRSRVLHLDLPISLGILLAYGGSLHEFLSGASAGYFDTVTVFVTLMLVGRWLQQRAIERNRDFLLRNDGVDLLRVRRLAGGEVQEVRVTEVAAGDLLLLAPGDLVPVRAELLERSGSFSLDWICGESVPREFAAGAELPAGAFHAGDTPLRARALADAESSGLLRLLRTPAQEKGEAARGTRFWTQLNRLYVAVVLLLAAAGATLWWLREPARAVEVAVAILVVTCPCAIGIALPLAFDLALARLRRSGIYVRTAGFLDKAARIRKVLFDKTGTLTWGELQAEVLREPPAKLRDVAYSMAASSNHPVARAVAAALRARGAGFVAELAVRELPGRGLEAQLGTRQFCLGSPAFVLGDAREQRGLTAATNGSTSLRAVDPAPLGRAACIPGVAPGEPLCLFRAGEQVQGCFAFHEELRAGYEAELRTLRELGYELHLVSGDRPERVARAAAALGFSPEHVRAAMSPDDKARYVAGIDAADTLMLGDGLNDAPAFDAAFAAGTAALDRPVLPARADFAVVGSGPGATLRVLRTGQQFARVVRTNLLLALLYNAVVVVLALAGRMSPVLCAVLMPLSSLALLAHTAVRLRPSREREIAPWT